MEVPALLLALDHVRGQIFPGNVGGVLGELGAADRHHVGHERIEEPFLLGALAGLRVVAAELAQLLARLDAELDAAVPQHLAGLALVNLGVHVERGEQRIERRGGRVHQERFVEALVLDVALLAADMLVALVDLRGLREAGALLVDRLRGEQPRHLRRELLDAASGCGPRTADGRRCSRSRPRPTGRSRTGARSSPGPCARCRSCRRRSRAGCTRAGTGARPCAAPCPSPAGSRGSARADTSRPRPPSRPRRSCRRNCAPSAGRSGSRRPAPGRPDAGTCGCCGRTGPGRRAAAPRW